MDLVTLVLFVIGIGLLIVGAELLVKGASTLALAVGISPLVIGLTVVAFGTSSPEMAVSVQAGLNNEADLALGNVVGSNIFNVLFILGISALVAPLIVSKQLVRLDVPIMIGASVAVFLMALDGAISRLDSATLFAAIVIYTVFLVRQGRRDQAKADAEVASSSGAPVKVPARNVPLQIGYVFGGLALLVIGSRWLVNGATEIAEAAGVSDLVIGLTIVAAGTSLPEVATSLLASIRGQRDIAVGNVIGSNIFNLLAVLGLSGLVSSGGIPVADSVISFDFPVALVVAVACLPIFFTGHLIARWEGGVFLAYYVAYTAYLLLSASNHDALDSYSTAMVWFVIPITVLTLAIVLVRSLRGPAVAGPPAATA